MSFGETNLEPPPSLVSVSFVCVQHNAIRFRSISFWQKKIVYLEIVFNTEIEPILPYFCCKQENSGGKKIDNFTIYMYFLLLFIRPLKCFFSKVKKKILSDILKIAIILRKTGFIVMSTLLLVEFSSNKESCEC